MHATIESLRLSGTWVIVPEGEWYDSLHSLAHGQCECGYEINHSFFAALIIEGEIIRTVECGSSCIYDLTNGRYYKQASEWHALSDNQMFSLFLAGHTIKTAYDVLYAAEVNKFYVSVYDFAMSQLAKTGLARVTENQYRTIQKILV